MTEPFSTSVLQRLRAIREVRIVTGEPGREHRTIIWVVVDGNDRVLIRSWLGARARWYREIRSRPDCALEVDRREIPMRAVDAIDEASIAACSQGLLTKYADSPSTPAMVADDVLDTTLELVPR